MKYYLDFFKVDSIYEELIFSALFILLCFVLLLFSGCTRDQSPPDLSSCTRIEIRYPRSNLNYFIPSSSLQDTLLSSEEKVYIQSIEYFTISDPKIIKAFSHDVRLGSYIKSRDTTYPCLEPVKIHCYRNKEHLISFTVAENEIITKDGHIFSYPSGKPDVERIEPLEMQPFKLRFQCALNMQTIYTSGSLYRKKINSYPEPTEWCDAVMQGRKDYLSKERMTGHFKCPTAGKGKSTYAMNPNCKLESPDDMVLLFETKAGWNQHGGPELFTFDNHDPKGGCVLLNDGTVKFIRTKEELQQLRWK